MWINLCLPHEQSTCIPYSKRIMILMCPKHKQIHHIFLTIHHCSGNKISTKVICSRGQQAACGLFMISVRRWNKSCCIAFALFLVITETSMWRGVWVWEQSQQWYVHEYEQRKKYLTVFEMVDLGSHMKVICVKISVFTKNNNKVYATFK